MTANQYEFLALALVAILGAVGVVTFNNPVRAALSLVLNFFVLGILYFFLGAQLLGITQIMVYAGAIMVLFLFVIMMLRLGDTTNKVSLRDSRVVFAFLFGTAFFVIIFFLAVRPLSGFVPQGLVTSYGAPETIGQSIFTAYAWPFELVSILLLVGIVGSIVLAKRRI